MKISFHIFLIIFIIYLTSQEASALSISLKDAVKTALENNEDISVANFNIEKSKELMKEVRSMQMPKIAAEIHYAVTDMRFYNDSGLIRNDTGVNAGASLEMSYVLASFGYIKKSMEAAALAQEVSLANKMEAADNLSMRVKIAYFSALSAQENEKILGNSLNEIKKLRTIASIQGKSKKDSSVLDGTFYQMKSLWETSKHLSKESLKLLSVLCDTYEPITNLKDSFDNLEIPNINDRELADRIETSPAMLSLNKTVDFELKNARKEEAANNPSLNIFGRYTFMDQSAHPTLNDPLWIGGGYIGIGLFVPIYDGGLAKAKSRKERLQAYITMSKKEQTERYLLGELTNMFDQFNEYKEIAKTNKLSEIAFKKAYNEYVSDFKKSKTSAEETLEILNKLTDARLKKIQSLYNIHESIAVMGKISGGSI